MSKDGCHLCNYQGCDDCMFETKAHQYFNNIGKSNLPKKRKKHIPIKTPYWITHQK